MDLARYSRQVLFAPIGEEGQRKLLKSKVLIVGMGALGTVVANHLVRAGVGHVRFVDRDFVEYSNLQRQILFDEHDVAESLPKAVAAERKLKRINSEITIEGMVGDVTPVTIADYAQDMDLILDGTDNFQTRFLMNDYSVKHNLPYIYGGIISSRGMQATFIPGKTPCLRCLIEDSGGTGETCDTAGVIAPVVDIISSFEAVEAIKLLVGAEDKIRQGFLSIDIWNYHLHEIKWGKPKENCASCQQKLYPALEISMEEQITSLCGRETIQITPRGQRDWNLDEWQQRLAKVADVQKTPFLLRCHVDNVKLVLFPDGRVLIQGTEDVAFAKNVYAKYIGM